jgi:hypothetical protein
MTIEKTLERIATALEAIAAGSSTPVVAAPKTKPQKTGEVVYSAKHQSRAIDDGEKITPIDDDYAKGQATAPVPETDAPTLSKDQLRVELSALMKDKPNAPQVITSILKEYGAPNLTKLDEQHHNVVLQTAKVQLT